MTTKKNIIPHTPENEALFIKLANESIDKLMIDNKYRKELAEQIQLIPSLDF